MGCQGQDVNVDKKKELDEGCAVTLLTLLTCFSSQKPNLFFDRHRHFPNFCDIRISL